MPKSKFEKVVGTISWVCLMVLRKWPEVSMKVSTQFFVKCIIFLQIAHLSILTRFTWRRIVLFSTQLLIFPWEMYIFARKYSDFLNISKRSIQWLNKNSKYMPINRLYSLWNNGAVSGTGFWKIMWTFFPYSTILYENSH